MFHSASEADIKAGRVTDVYFARTHQILEAYGIRKRVKAEFITKDLPEGWGWGVLAGIEECAELLRGRNVRVTAMREGTLFAPWQPVLVIEGDYQEFGVYETALLGFLCQASGVATKAARCKKAAGDRAVISFGARRMHPAISPMIERNAYIGGCDGVAAVSSAALIGIEPSGTMPHALILLMGDTVKAAEAFHSVISPAIRRVALIDTMEDEKFEAIRVAQALGQDLYAVRLDTPGSRRGDFLQILKEVRWELDLRGFQHVKILVSGGIDERKILELNPVADGYGVGTSISAAATVDFAMDIVEIEGEPLAKRGKMSGGKAVLRCGRCHRDEIVPEAAGAPRPCTCQGTMENLLVPLLEGGQLPRPLPRPQAIRAYVLDQLPHYEL
ncbi:MAG: nicotinate phosphoribosyltransferase [Deltaproteobacteria bacterium]|nr:nicotinate phosphoribosyltransferase [Deltaproteobacteria bacterium]